MQDFDKLVRIDSEIIQASLESLVGDDRLNYLYFLRDEIAKKIKTVKE